MFGNIYMVEVYNMLMLYGKYLYIYIHGISTIHI